MTTQPSDWTFCNACGFTANLLSAEVYRAHKAHHLAAYPECDLRTRQSLDTVIAWAERHA